MLSLESAAVRQFSAMSAEERQAYLRAHPLTKMVAAERGASKALEAALRSLVTKAASRMPDFRYGSTLVNRADEMSNGDHVEDVDGPASDAADYVAGIKSAESVMSRSVYPADVARAFKTSCADLMHSLVEDSVYGVLIALGGNIMCANALAEKSASMWRDGVGVLEGEGYSASDALMDLADKYEII